jgi:hypothetical protein
MNRLFRNARYRNALTQPLPHLICDALECNKLKTRPRVISTATPGFGACIH